MHIRTDQHDKIANEQEVLPLDVCAALGNLLAGIHATTAKAKQYAPCQALIVVLRNAQLGIFIILFRVLRCGWSVAHQLIGLINILLIITRATFIVITWWPTNLAVIRIPA